MCYIFSTTIETLFIFIFFYFFGQRMIHFIEINVW